MSLRKCIGHIAGLVLIAILFSQCAGIKPVYDFQIPDQKVPATVTFDNKTMEADSFLWNFGDGNISRDSSPTHTYYLSGRYQVQLKAMKDGKENILTKELFLSPPEKCLVLLMTEKGDMMIELYPETPLHRDNFIKLAEENYYDSLLFHRVIEGFMIQGGDPNSRNAGPQARLGTGGPKYRIDAEFVPGLYHYKGVLAAARQPDNVNPDRKSSGSQFYIVHGKVQNERSLNAYASRSGIEYDSIAQRKYFDIGGTPQLDNGYTVFGEVIDGLEVIDKIATVKRDRVNRPLEDIRILKLVVIK